MEFLKEFRDVLKESITVSEFLSRDSYGAPQYGSPASYSARLVRVNRLVRNGEGSQEVSSHHLWVEPITGLTSEWDITLADGSNPVILAVESYTDEIGPTHMKVFFQ